MTASATRVYNASASARRSVGRCGDEASDGMAHDAINDAMLGSLLAAMDLAAFEYVGEGRLRPVGRAPVWVGRFVSIHPGESIELRRGGRFEFLADFFDNAEAFWSSNPTGRLRSGIWTETDASGSESHFEATALSMGDRRMVLIELLGAEFYERRDLLQKARSGKLAADRILTREMSERERAELRVDQLRGQLAHVGRISAMGEMAASLAHELNQPLWAMINYVQAGLNLLNSGADAERVRGALSRGVAQAERAGRILRGLRDFIAEGTPRRRATDVNELVGEVAQLLESELRHGEVQPRIDAAGGALRVFADPIQVQQVMFNLMRNAIEAMTDDGVERRELAVTTAMEGGVVSVCVSDTGPGCDESAMGRLFDAFYSTKLGGMGMGLAISRTIVEAHGGSIEAAGGVGGGLSVTFTLPAYGEGAER